MKFTGYEVGAVKTLTFYWHFDAAICGYLHIHVFRIRRSSKLELYSNVSIR